jgi:hypothetical protein
MKLKILLFLEIFIMYQDKQIHRNVLKQLKNY